MLSKLPKKGSSREVHQKKLLFGGGVGVVQARVMPLIDLLSYSKYATAIANLKLLNVPIEKNTSGNFHQIENYADPCQIPPPQIPAMFVRR